jgi:CRP-like cAMP-binding protein
VDPVGILLKTGVFGDLRPDDVEELLPVLGERTLDRGESLWLEGDPAIALYVLVEGQLKSHRVGRDGGEVILLLQSDVDIVGEVGLFHPSGVRRVSVTAMTPARLLRIPKSPLLAFLSRHPVAMERMLERLSAVAGQAAYSFSGLAFDDIRRRVAGALLRLGEEFGEPTRDEGVRIRLRLSQSTLAALVAASRENVNRALTSLVSTGVVSQRDGHFHIHDLIALERAAAANEDL